MPIVEQSKSGFSVKMEAPAFKKPLPAPVRTVPTSKLVAFEQFTGPVEVVIKEVAAAAEMPPAASKPPLYRSFQVIPHATVKNEKIDLFADVLADSYREIFDRLGLGLRLDEPDRVFFETVIEPKSFRTYITTNAALVDELKRQANTTWKNVTLVDADSPVDTAEKANSLGIDMKLKRHFFQSLKTDRRMQTTPLAEIAELTRSMSDGDRVVIQFGWQNAEDGWQKDATKEMKDQEEAQAKRKGRRPEPSKSTTMKAAYAGYDFTLRILVTSPDERRRRMLARGVVLALKQLNEDNELIERQVGHLRMNRWLKRLKRHHIAVPLFRQSRRQIVTAPEIAHFVKLPQRALQEEHPHLIANVSKPEAEIQSCFAEPDGIFVGTATYRDKEVDVHLPTESTDMLMTARAFMGSPRQGKDQAIINLIVESKRKHGIGAIIPDWIDERKRDEDGNWRGMANAIRDALPPEDVIDIDWSDFDHPVPFGLQAVTRDIANARIAADRISKELTSFLMGDDPKEHMTREYLRDAAKVCAGDLLDIKRLFQDTNFRQEKIEWMELTGIGDAEMWRQFDEDLSDARRAQIFAPVNVRLGEIVNDEVLAPIFCQQPNPKADFRRWIEEGKVVILRIPTGTLSEMSVKILAYYSVMVPFLIKLSMDGRGCPMWIVINEPHQVETPEFVHFICRILAEGPKHLIAPIFAFHHLGQLSQDFADTLVSSSLSWHLFYNSNMRMYEKLKAQIEPFTPETAMKQTPRFHFIAAGWRDALGAAQNAFMVRAPKPVKDRWQTFDNAHLTKEHARRFGRPIGEVLADIKRRSRVARKMKEDGGKQTKASS